MCCGNPSGRSLPNRQSDRRSQTGAPFAVPFEYVGATGLTVVGPFTGRRYRFEGRGSRASVDLRDAPSMAAVPHLRRV